MFYLAALTSQVLQQASGGRLGRGELFGSNFWVAPAVAHQPDLKIETLGEQVFQDFQVLILA